jgi:hypothetical protein
VYPQEDTTNNNYNADGNKNQLTTIAEPSQPGIVYITLLLFANR